MGLFSKKKTQITYKFRPLVDDPYSKTKYGKSNKYFNKTQKKFLQKMLQNDIDGMTGGQNIDSLMEDANRIYDKPIMFRKEFAEEQKIVIVNYNTTAIENFLKPSYNSHVSLWAYGRYTDISEPLVREYMIMRQLDSYDVGSQKGIKDGYTVIFDRSFYSFMVDSIDTTKNPNATLIEGGNYEIDSLGITLNFEHTVEEPARELIDEEFTKQTNIDPKTLESYDVDIVEHSIVPDSSDNTLSRITVTANIVYKKPIIPTKELVTLTVSYTFKTLYIELSNILKLKNKLWVKYDTYTQSTSKVTLTYIDDQPIFRDSKEEKIRLSARLDIKGGTHSEKQEKYLKQALKLNGFLSIKKHQENEGVSEEKAKDLYTQIQNEDKIKEFNTQMTLNLVAFMKKSVRESREWQLYLRAFFLYFEKYCDYGSNMKYTPSYTFEIPSIKVAKTALRIKVAKKRIKSKVIHKRCFISTEAGYHKSCLYLNVPDFSETPPEDTKKGIFHHYTQYILDLDHYFGFYDKYIFSAKQSERESQDGTRYGPMAPSMFIEFEIATGKDVEEFEKKHKHRWYNDGKQKMSRISLQYKVYKEITIGSGQDQSTIKKLVDVIESYTEEEFIAKWGPILGHRDSIIKLAKERLFGSVGDWFLGNTYNNYGYNHCIFPIDDINSIPDHYNPAYGVEDGFYTNTHLHQFYPPMPIQLWFRVPYIAKLEVFLACLWCEYKLVFVYKKATFLGKIFGFVKIVLGAFLTYFFPPLAFIGEALILSGVVDILTQICPELKTFFTILAVVNFFYSYGFSLDNILAGIGEETLKTVSGMISVSSQLFDYVTSTSMETSMEKARAEVAQKEEETKALQKILDEKDGLMLNTSVSSVDTDMSVGGLYELAYGVLLYSSEGFENLTTMESQIRYI